MARRLLRLPAPPDAIGECALDLILRSCSVRGHADARFGHGRGRAICGARTPPLHSYRPLLNSPPPLHGNACRELPNRGLDNGKSEKPAFYETERARTAPPPPRSLDADAIARSRSFRNRDGVNDAAEHARRVTTGPAPTRRRSCARGRFVRNARH